MTHPSMLATSLAAALLGIGALRVADAASEVPAVAAARSSAAILRESADCRRSRPRVEVPAAVATADNVQQLAVNVPAIAMLRVDADGSIIAAATSTGCRPHAGDLVYVQRPDGSIVLTTAIDLESVLWTGDFTTPGSYQPQQAQRPEHRRAAVEVSGASL